MVAPINPSRLSMPYMGADWLRSNLKSAQRRSKSPKPVHVSPLGESVADLLGFVWRGIYHLPWSLLEKSDWADERMVEVRIREDIATWDYDTLTRLVVVAFDMGLRLSVYPNGPYGLRLSFWQRHQRFRMGDRNGMNAGIPTLDDCVVAIRAGYEVEGQCKS